MQVSVSIKTDIHLGLPECSICQEGKRPCPKCVERIEDRLRQTFPLCKGFRDGDCFTNLYMEVTDNEIESMTVEEKEEE